MTLVSIPAAPTNDSRSVQTAAGSSILGLEPKSEMAEENGDYLSRFERSEQLSERHTQQIGELISHAAAPDRRIEILHESQLETNTQIESLRGALRDLIERIPPENLR